MRDDSDLFCKVYVDVAMERPELVNLIEQVSQGDLDAYTITTPSCEIDVMKNDDFDPQLRLQFPDGFLHFRYYLDVFPKATIESEIYILEISRLLQDLWSKGIPAVAASDFEDELPSQGGYKSSSVPWPSA